MSPRHTIVFTVTISVFSIILRLLSNNNMASSISAVVKQQPLIDVVTCRQSSDLPKHWCIDNTSTTQYTGNIEENSSLNIQHYIHNGYEKFQVNKTIIVFIGDSTMRYQCMHLVAFLKYQRLMQCEDHNVSAVSLDVARVIGNHDISKVQQNVGLTRSISRSSIIFCAIVTVHFHSVQKFMR